MIIPEQRKKILEIFLRNPFDEIHLRKISKISKVSLNNISKTMELYVEQDLFKRRDVSDMAFFKPNIKNDTMLKLFEFLEVERKNDFYLANKKISRMLKKYTNRLIQLSEREIQIIVLFGSVARGEWTKNSDVDILSVISKKNKLITTVLNKAKVDVSPLLKTSPVSVTINKFKEGLKNKNEFYEKLWKDRIILYNEFLFWQLLSEGGN